MGGGSERKKKMKVDLENTINCNAKQKKRQKVEDKRLRLEEHANEHGVAWPAK